MKRKGKDSKGEPMTKKLVLGCAVVTVAISANKRCVK